MWPNNHAPGIPGGPFSAAFTGSRRIYSPAHPPSCLRAPPRRTLRLPIGTSNSDPSNGSRLPPPSLVIDPHVPTLLTAPTAEISLAPAESPRKRLAGFDPHSYPSPPSSHTARSPPSPTNLPPIACDTAPPPFHPATSPPSALLGLTPSRLEQMAETMTGRITFPGTSSALFSSWQALYPSVREADHLRYEFDARTSRFVIKCATSPVHESVSVFFINRMVGGLQARLGIDAYEDTVHVSSGMTFDSFTAGYGPTSMKVPDTYLLVIGDDFPAVVCETGWSESMENLRADAELWLVGSGGQTRVVVVVAFQESYAAEADPVAEGGEPDAAGQPDNEPHDADDPPDNTAAEPSDDTAVDPAEEPSDEREDPASVAEAEAEAADDTDATDPFPEETALLASISPTTQYNDLAASLLTLHRSQHLRKPLLGRITASLHIFRLAPCGTKITETFSAPVLPACASAPASFALTLADLLGSAVVAAKGLDPDEQIVFPLDRLRKQVADQIAPQEKRRARARAEKEMRGCEVWVQQETFAMRKRAKRKRGE